MIKIPKKQITLITKEIRSNYSSYKVGDIAVQLYLHGISQDDIDYILQDGQIIKNEPYETLQIYLAKVMDRMEQRITYELAVKVRRDSACCLKGKREQLAQSIYNNYDSIEKRFETLSVERNIIGGKGWKKNNYRIVFW